MRRESYSNRFATALDGVDLDEPGVALDRTGHENPVPRVVGPIRRTRPVEVRDVEFLRSLTDRRIKITVPGPFTMTQQAQNDHYADDREPRARVRRGRQRGAARPQGGRRRRRPDRRAVPPGAARAGARVRGRGDRPRARRDRGRDRPPHLLRLRAHRPRPARPATRSSRELDELRRDAPLARGRAAGPRPGGAARRSPARRSCSASSTSARAEVETPEVVAEPDPAARSTVVPPERLVVAPDCGMKYLPRERAFRKLEAMVAGARLVRRISASERRRRSPVSRIAQAYPDRVEVRGRDLAGDLMGRLSFTEYFHLLLTGREPTEEQRFFLDLLLVAIAEHGLMPTNVAARMTLAADPGLAPGRRRGGDPRRGPGRARHVRGVRAAARAAQARRARATRRRATIHAARRQGARASAIRCTSRVDPRAERILELADERGVSGPHVALARALPRRRRRGLGQAADDERLDADRGGAARPRLPGRRREGGPDPRAHGGPARASRRGAGAAARLPAGARRPRRRSSTSAA